MDFATRPLFTKPENLSKQLLQMLTRATVVTGFIICNYFYRMQTLAVFFAAITWPNID